MTRAGENVRDADGARVVPTLRAPGFIPDEITVEMAEAIAHLIAAMLHEAGHPCRPVPSEHSLFERRNWQWEPDPPRDLLNRARLLAFERFGVLHLFTESEPDWSECPA